MGKREVSTFALTLIVSVYSYKEYLHDDWIGKNKIKTLVLQSISEMAKARNIL
jgi:hypothetical protein